MGKLSGGDNQVTTDEHQRPRITEEGGPLRDWLPRTVGLLVGTLALATAFIAAYVGALHQPTPHDVPVGVIFGDQRAQQVLSGVRAHTDAIRPVGYDNQDDAGDALAERRVYAVLRSDGNGLLLTTASASAPAATDLVTSVLGQAARQAQAPLTVTDGIPVASADPRGLVPFYLAVGLVLGGYLASTALGLAAGTAPRGLRRAGLRIASLAAHAVLLGLAGALIVGPIMNIWEHDVLAVWAAGALTVFTAGMVAAAVQGWLGLFGTGLVILLLVVLGNPGSGGIYAPEFLPGFLRGMHRWNVPGLSTDLLKSVVYFDRRAIAWPLVGLFVWLAVAVVALLTATLVRGRPQRHRTGPGEPCHVSATEAHPAPPDRPRPTGPGEK